MLRSMPSVRPVVCRGTHLLIVTMAHLLWSMLMLIRATSLHHSALPISLPTTKGARATPTPSIPPQSHLHKTPCGHLVSNPEHPMLHNLSLNLPLNTLQPNWRA
uniref:Uncharacterized protein n=1 Tax=Opuntia streptacantha TaxID=393608 RepID=A0A7C9A1Z3_OPUST